MQPLDMNSKLLQDVNDIDQNELQSPVSKLPTKLIKKNVFFLNIYVF